MDLFGVAQWAQALEHTLIQILTVVNLVPNLSVCIVQDTIAWLGVALYTIQLLWYFQYRFTRSQEHVIIC